MSLSGEVGLLGRANNHDVIQSVSLEGFLVSHSDPSPK
jgi:hypothetical protein